MQTTIKWTYTHRHPVDDAGKLQFFFIFINFIHTKATSPEKTVIPCQHNMVSFHFQVKPWISLNNLLLNRIFETH